MSSLSRSNLARLIDSSDEDSAEIQSQELPEPNKKTVYRDSWLSPNKVKSPGPKLERSLPVPKYVSGLTLQSALIVKQDGAGADKAGRIFSSLFPDDSEEEEDGNQSAPECTSSDQRIAAVAHEDYDDSFTSSTAPRGAEKTPGAITKPLSPPTPKGSTVISRSYNPDVRPSISAPFSRADESLPLDGVNDIPSTFVPSTAAKYLKNYQVIGTRWLWNKYVNRLGGILGDDMGLGKTIQVIAFLLGLFGKTGIHQVDVLKNRSKRKHGCTSGPSSVVASDGSGCSSSLISPAPCLIVCPASVVSNWENELNKWGYFLLNTLGTPDDVSIAIQNAADCRCDIVLGSYAKMRRNIECLSKIRWSTVIWDEGHCLKGDKTQLYEACLKLDKVRCRFILSGTPVQNKLEELWALLNLLNRGVVQSKDAFKQHFVEPIKRGGARNAHSDAVALSNKRQYELQKLVTKYMLQRFKEVELSDELKSKEDIVVFCSLSDIQSRIYEHLLSLHDFDNCRFHHAECPCGSALERKGCCEKYRVPLLRDTAITDRRIDPRAYIWRKAHATAIQQFTGESDQLHCVTNSSSEDKLLCEEYEDCPSCPHCISLPCIMTLMKVASHPLLFQVDASCSDKSKNEDKMNFLRYCLTPELVHEIGGYKYASGTAFEGSNNEMSGKMLILEKLLENFTRMRFKTLLFSYSTKMLSIIENYIRSKGWSYLRLDGSTPGIKRQGLVDQFNNDVDLPIFLISTRAGGMGLNLTSASKVIIFDCSWNPTMDMQAQDRCYRYGQTKQVSVYRLIAQGTVEELVYMRQLYKQALQLSAIQRRPEISGEDPGALDGGITVNSSQEGEIEQKTGGDYTARRNRLGEGKRAFNGVEGGPHGELFGLENLLQFEKSSILGILRRKHKLDRTVMNIGSDFEDDIEEQNRAELDGGNKGGMNTLAGSDAFGIVNTDVKSGHSEFGSGFKGGGTPSKVPTKVPTKRKRKTSKPSASQYGSPRLDSTVTKDCDFFTSDEDESVAVTTSTVSAALLGGVSTTVQLKIMQERAQHERIEMNCTTDTASAATVLKEKKCQPEATPSKRRKIAPAVRGALSLLYVPSYANMSNG